MSPPRQCGIGGDAELEKNEKAISSRELPLVSAHISVAVTTTQQFEVPTLNVPDEADDSPKPTHLETGNARKLREEKTSTSYSNSTLTLVNAHLPEHKRVVNVSLQLLSKGYFIIHFCSFVILFIHFCSLGSVGNWVTP